MPDLLLRLARFNMSLFQRRQTHLSGGQSFRTHGVDWLCAPNTGTLLFPQCRQADTDAVLQAAVTHCHAQGVGVRAMCNFPTPRHIRQRIYAWGFHYEFCLLMMASDLNALPEYLEYAVPSGLEITLLTDTSLFDSHPHPWYGDLNDPKNRRDFEVTAYLANNTKGVWNLVALEEGRPVGSVTLSACSVSSINLDAGLYNVGVLQEKRRQGIGTALVHAACRFAKAQGYRVATLQCGPHLRGFYGENGFEEVGITEAWSTGENKGDLHKAPATFPPPEAQDRTPDLAEIDFLTLLTTGKATLALKTLRRNPALVRAMLPNWEATPLHLAAFYGQTEMAHWLLKHGADPQARDPRFQSTPEGWANHNKQAETAAFLHQFTATPPS